MKFPEQNGGNFNKKCWCLIVKYKKNCGSVRVTTSEFVLSVSKSIDSCKLKVDPEWGQRNWTIIGHRIRPNRNHQYAKYQNWLFRAVVVYQHAIIKKAILPSLSLSLSFNIHVLISSIQFSMTVTALTVVQTLNRRIDLHNV
jgi:hypothetical protein